MRNNKSFVKWDTAIRQSIILLTCALDNILTARKMIDCVASQRAANGYNPSDLYKLNNELRGVYMYISNYKCIVERNEQEARKKHLSRMIKWKDSNRQNTKNNPF